ncbi:MAG TPA: hypothetical protein VJZ50_06715 [Candidatus Limnocylindrales bacterium]|nr:hypothetical protein [Candidatus Limnocylindrales bacterium]
MGCLSRFAGTLLATTLLLAVIQLPVLAVSQDADPTTAASAKPTKIQRLDADLAPLNVSIMASLDDIGAGITSLYGAVGILDLEALPDYADAIHDAVVSIRKAAQEALRILDRYEPVPTCMREYVAVVRVAYTLLLDVMDAILAGNAGGSAYNPAAAIWLLDTYGTLVRSLVDC